MQRPFAIHFFEIYIHRVSRNTEDNSILKRKKEKIPSNHLISSIVSIPSDDATSCASNNPPSKRFSRVEPFRDRTAEKIDYACDRFLGESRKFRRVARNLCHHRRSTYSVVPLARSPAEGAYSKVRRCMLNFPPPPAHMHATRDPHQRTHCTQHT